MQPIGIVRRIDYMGRITIPKEVRRTMNLPDGTILGMFTDGENIILKKYIPQEVLLESLKTFESQLEQEEADLEFDKVKEIGNNIKNIHSLLSGKI